MAFVSTNPATGEVVATFDNMSDAKIEAVLAASMSAHKTLKSWSMEDRRAAMHRIADILEDEAEKLGAIITLEMGKTLASAIGEVKKCAMGCRYYADNAAAMMADEIVNATAAMTYKKYLPLGPIMVVMPWNYPFEDVVRRAGFPEGALQNIFVTIDQVGEMLRDDRIRGATLTGSERAGASVASICGQEIKPTVLELGGSDAFIVMPSADLDKAVSVGVTARTQNCGQSCIAGKRFIVHEDVYDEFRAKFKAAFEALNIGDPNDPKTDMGPLVTERAREEIAEQVDSAVRDGAVRVTGAELVDGKGFFYRPGILESIPKSSKAYYEEIFGPVAILFKVNSIEEAIDIANDSPFGLGSSIFTQDKREQELAIEEIEAGATFVNSMTASHPALPFGGVKRSGYGRELAAEGLRAFCNVKTVSIA